MLYLNITILIKLIGIVLCLVTVFEAIMIMLTFGLLIVALLSEKRK
ncbi:putative holin-like toxin [Paenibacillus algorifonticola]